MKTLNLSAYSVSEMTKQEMVETDGGFIGIITMPSVPIVVGEILDEIREQQS
ncbi:MAG: hypothetical protein FWC94_03465 [Bacteroidales bacterium]|nr:hypothetical protein [Bacteroidales bacterium]